MENNFVLLIGFGDAGKVIFEVLEKSNVRFTVVDANPELFQGSDFDYIVGNGTDEDVLKRAGVEEASTVVIALSNDSDVMFATLISRRLNSDAIILARANTYTSIDKIYKAGADYVASLSIVAGQMLAKMTSKCMDTVCEYINEDIMLYEGLSIEKHHVDTGEYLEGKSIGQLDLINAFGCKIIGIQRGNSIITDIDASVVIQKGDVVAVLGIGEQVSDFLEHITS